MYCANTERKCLLDWKDAIVARIPFLVSIPQSIAPPRYAMMIKLALFLRMVYALGLTHPKSKKKWARFPKNSLGPPCMQWAFAGAKYSPKYYSRLYCGGASTSCWPPCYKLSAETILLLVMVSGCTLVRFPACRGEGLHPLLSDNPPNHACSNRYATLWKLQPWGDRDRAPALIIRNPMTSPDRTALRARAL